MGESAGGYLTCMAALDQDKKLDTGEYLEYSSQVQAACPWYPPTDASHFHMMMWKGSHVFRVAADGI